MPRFTVIRERDHNEPKAEFGRPAFLQLARIDSPIMMSHNDWCITTNKATSSSCLAISRHLLLFLLACIPSVAQDDGMVSSQPPRLDGRKLVFTVAIRSSFVGVSTNSDGSLEYAGYLVDMMQAMARPDRANFEFELRTPSGVGPDCVAATSEDSEILNAPYGKAYWSQYNCAANDVELTNSTYRTDGYLGLFYASLSRMQKFQLTIPYNPPYKGTPAMFGTVTGLSTIESVAERQKTDDTLHVCMPGSTATLDMVRGVFPDLRITEFYGDDHDLYTSLDDGTCSIYLFDAPIGQYMVRKFSEQGRCHAKGKVCCGSKERANEPPLTHATCVLLQPIGLIGEPMQFGLSHYSIGISKDLPVEVEQVLSYWMTYLMTCSPVTECPEGNLATFYNNRGGTGFECGYELYPPKLRMSKGKIVATAIGCLAGLVLLFLFLHRRRMVHQERRYKKRFVQQIARNIDIGPSPGSIPPRKLSEQIMHISKHKGFIGKEDLRQWLLDIKMTFISDKDFDALWSAMDIENTGQVDPVQFIVFLSACGPQFEEVYNEQAGTYSTVSVLFILHPVLDLPKNERLKLAARRLSNISRLGEDGVKRLERRLERVSGSKQRALEHTSTSTIEPHSEGMNIDEGGTHGTNDDQDWQS